MKNSEYIQKELSRHTDDTVKAAYQIAAIIDQYDIPLREVYDIVGLLQVIMTAKCADH